MLPDYAFKLSDNYILKCELLNDYHKINNLRHFMIMDFAKRVNQLHKGAPASKLISAICQSQLLLRLWQKNFL